MAVTNKKAIIAVLLTPIFSAPAFANEPRGEHNSWNYVELDMIQVAGGGRSDYQGLGLEVSKELGKSFFADLAYYKYDFSDSYGTFGFTRTSVGAGYKTEINENLDIFGQISIVTLSPINSNTNLGDTSNFTDLSLGIKGRLNKIEYKVAAITSQSAEKNGSNSSGFSLDTYYLINESFSAGLELESFEHEDAKSISVRYHF